MAVTRVVANLAAPDPMALAKFYKEVFELELPFDMGWIVFLGTDTQPRKSSCTRPPKEVLGQNCP